MTDQNNAAQAIQEAERIAAADEYFKARAWIMDTNDNRRIFEAGFDRAYALLSKLRAPVADRQHLRELVDVVWNEATESTAVPDTPWADRLIDKVFPSLAASAPVAKPKPAPVDDGICWSSKEIQRRQKEEDEARAAYYHSRASAPVAGEAQPIGWMSDAGRESLRKFGQASVVGSGARSEPSEFRHPLYAAPQASEAQCSCPSGDGSLRHPCAVHPQGSEAVRDALVAFDEAMNLCDDFPELQHHRDALRFAVQNARAALSAQPGAQKNGSSDGR